MKKAVVIVLMMALLITTGCGQKAGQEQSDALKITAESYGLVRMGMSYKKVCDTLGIESTVIADSFTFPSGISETEKNEFAGAQYHTWYELDHRGNTIPGNSISVAILNGMVVAKNFKSDFEPYMMTDPISLERFRDLEFGMSYKGIVGVVGDPMVLHYDYVDKNQHVAGYAYGLWPEWELEFEFADDKMIYKYIAYHKIDDYSQYEISKSVFESLEIGMSYDEVCSITGSTGCFMYEEATRDRVEQVFVWWYESQATFYFADGYLYDYESGGSV